MTEEFNRKYIAARKAVINREFQNLNPMQREAVMATEGPLLILAGAGSGKTTVLINRIANLLKYGRGSDCDYIPPNASQSDIERMQSGDEYAQELACVDPVEPWRILAITFTNKAAEELKNRLCAMLGEKADDIWACTFHSACVRILRKNAEDLGFSRSFTIYDTSDSQSVVKHIIKEMELDEKTFGVKPVLSEISRAKDAQISAEDYLKEARLTGDIRKVNIGRVYYEYMKRLRAADAMDFDDLIYNTVALLENCEEAKDYWQRRFRYVLIDEYQDTNHLQYLLASHLAEKSGNICVVGDDDQSIYKFRGATIENILSFEEEYENCRTIRLEQNYRSTGHILDAANAVIRNNLGRKGKELWTNAGTGDKVELFVADNEHEEAQYVASQILANFSHGANWKDHAVLYRMNAQSNQMEYAFKRSGIPYRIIGGTRFFDRAEVKDILAYLNVIATVSDDLRLTRIINVPVRGIGEKSVETARAIAADNGITLFEVLKNAESYKELSRAGLKMRCFAMMIEELRDYAQTHKPDEVFDELLRKTAYVQVLNEKNTPEDTARAENVEEIKTSILSYMQDSGDETLEGYLANVALYTDLDNYDKDSDAVIMMTMHSAKGLEFPNVFVIGMEESLFPSIRAIGERDEMEEERRLCYVAITRAKKKLEFVCARQRMLFGKTTSNRVSRFIDEIPPEHINKNIPKGYGYSDRSAQLGFAYSGQYSSGSQYKINSPAYRNTETASRSGAVQFSVGDNVRHKAFGEGVIVKLTPMGGDSLVEINFASVGTKRLMLRAAAMHMTKE